MTNQMTITKRGNDQWIHEKNSEVAHKQISLGITGTCFDDNVTQVKTFTTIHAEVTDHPVLGFKLTISSQDDIVATGDSVVEYYTTFDELKAAYQATVMATTFALNELIKRNFVYAETYRMANQ